jgi:hypothetical protein
MSDHLNTTQKYPCIIPTVLADYTRTKSYYNSFFKYLPIDEIILIGPENIREIAISDQEKGIFGDNKISFIAENEIIPIQNVKDIYGKLLCNALQPNPSSVNWYYQQYLKMAYAQICTSEYYLCWDSDTIPLKPIEMFSQEGIPYLDTKPDGNASYFLTIQRLFNFNKIIEKSFISEHMLFKKEYMLDLISDIEETSFEGNTFYEKITNSLGYDNLAIGFSEFETYGTWIGMKHPSAYKLRKWKSFRNLSFFVNIADFNEEDKEWLSKDYHAVTFEKYQETEPSLTELFRNPRYREKLSSEQFLLSVLESGALGEYSNGTIKYNGLVAPI